MHRSCSIFCVRAAFMKAERQGMKRFINSTYCLNIFVKREILVIKSKSNAPKIEGGYRSLPQHQFGHTRILMHAHTHAEEVLQQHAGKKSRKWSMGSWGQVIGVTPPMKYGSLNEALWWELPEKEISISQVCSTQPNWGQVVCTR